MALLAALATNLGACAGAYVAGDVGPHRAKTAAMAPVLDRARDG